MKVFCSGNLTDYEQTKTGDNYSNSVVEASPVYRHSYPSHRSLKAQNSCAQLLDLTVPKIVI